MYQIVAQVIRWDLYMAMDRVVFRTVSWVVYRAIHGAVSDAVYRAVDRAIEDDPTHAAYWDFRDAVDVESGTL